MRFNKTYDSKAERILFEAINKQGFAEWNAYKSDNKYINLEGINLEKAYLQSADLSNINLCKANLKKADLYMANLVETFLEGADLQESNLVNANLKRSQLKGANIGNARLNNACLIDAQANYSNLKGADFHNCYIQGADFSFAIVDGETLLDTDLVDDKTIFIGVGLASARLKPGLYDLLTYNMRKYRWNKWYNTGNLFLRCFKNISCRLFWFFSDYGASTIRLIITFMFFVFLFASLYYVLDILGCSAIENFSQINRNDKLIPLCTSQVVCRSLYFSIVTMTTLGFGDMYANPTNICGHILLSFQVMIGYILLGALVTRLSILFSTNGPEISPRRKKRPGK